MGMVSVSEAMPSIKVKVFRGEASNSDFIIESSTPLSIMALLMKVHEQDPTFACRTSTCFKGRCGSCLVRANGQDVFGCMTLVQPGETVIVEPHSKFKQLRDVVVDFSLPLSVGKE
jgi:succinate dehydrogenase/fumarate reductase-like Fe-S protein